MAPRTRWWEGWELSDRLPFKYAAKQMGRKPHTAADSATIQPPEPP